MKILLLHPYFYLEGGYGNDRSYESARYFAKQGHEVTVITTPAYFPKQKQFFKVFPYTIYLGNIQLWVCPVAYHHQMPLWRRLCSFIGYFIWGSIIAFFIYRPDVVYAISTPPTTGIIALLIKRVKKVPYLFEIGDLWPEVPVAMLGLERSFIAKISKSIIKILYQNAERIVGLSPEISAQIVSEYAHTKVTTIFNGTNIQSFNPSDIKSKAKHQLGYKVSDMVCIYTGTLGKANGFEFYIKLAAALPLDSKLKFLIIGDGTERKSLEQLAQKNGLNNLRFVNWIPKNQLLQWLQAADIGIVSFADYSILQTNSANKLYDYMACGIAVCINYNGWQAELLKAHHCGIVLPANPSIAAQQVFEVAQNKKALNDMGQNGRHLALKYFDREKLAHQTLDLLETIRG